MSIVWFGLFWPKKVHFNGKIDRSLTFMLINVFRAGYLSKIAKIFRTALTVQSAKKETATRFI